MEIKNNGDFSSSSVRAILLGEEADIANIPDAFKSACKLFLEGEDDFDFHKDNDSQTIFVKVKDDKEKNRKAGAELYNKVKKETSVYVHGVSSSTYEVIEGLVLSDYRFDKYLSDKEKGKSHLENVFVNETISDEEVQELLHAQLSVFWARDMINEPVSFLSAEQFAEEIKAAAVNAGIDCKILEKTQIESLKMGGLLAVNQGSIDAPTFTIVEYKPDNAFNSKPIVFVGKGVVYDTGGLSLKPTPNSMDIMKSDMAGAACVAGAIQLIALQKVPAHVIALIPATDNRPGLNAYAPGDVVKMYNGKTVEVLNTDAEGRMILADALSYAKKYNPELVIDAATLTGAAHRAIGEHAAIMMGNADQSYFDKLATAGEKCHERLVHFPFWDEYGEEMKSPIADLKNLGGPTAGMITAGKFLENFVESPYIHLDIAGPAWLDKNSAYRTKGGAGFGVRLLYHFVKDLANGK